MGTTEIIEPRVTSTPEPELHLLVPTSTFDESLWKSLFGNINDFFFPKKQAPLVLTSKPIPVADIWGFYNYKKNGVFGSTVVHILIVLLIIAGTILARRLVKAIEPPTQEMTLIRPDDVPVLPTSKTKVGGGGGGGDRDKLQAVKGKLPKTAMEQITPPAVIVRNEHPKLAVEPTVVVPPQIKMASNMPVIGDPMSHLPSGPPSNGTGSGGGIGAGSGGGVGVGAGPGVGDGRGGGIGGGVFRVGGGVSAPKAIFSPDPEYSEEGRKAKFQGTCVLMLIVGADGHARDIKVARTLGLGLDEEAINAVRQWLFEPGRLAGTPVNVLVTVVMDFSIR